MKVQSILLIGIFILIGLEIQAQDQKINPIYNKGLADSLGADEYGMKSYVFVILKTGNDTITNKEIRSSLFKGHMDNINSLAKEGLLYVAGPFEKNNLEYRGLFILNVKTVAEAKRLCDSDPAIKAGIFEVILLPWYGSAALGTYLEVADQISKFKM